MTNTVLYSYTIGWVITSICLALTARRLQGPPRPLSIVVAAGAVWPIIVLGTAQVAIVVLITEIARSWSGRTRSASEHGLEYSDDEIGALIDEWRIGFEQRL